MPDPLRENLNTHTHKGRFDFQTARWFPRVGSGPGEDGGGGGGEGGGDWLGISDKPTVAPGGSPSLVTWESVRAFAE